MPLQATWCFYTILYKQLVRYFDCRNSFIFFQMKAEQIQTLHPQQGKKNKRISLHKYNIIKENILAILANTELTHSELMEKLYDNVKDSFEGGVQWYGETVKLDLEARKIIKRTDTKPEKYKMVSNANIS
jgi:hypothetical protein